MDFPNRKFTLTVEQARFVAPDAITAAPARQFPVRRISVTFEATVMQSRNTMLGTEWWFATLLGSDGRVRLVPPPAEGEAHEAARAVWRSFLAEHEAGRRRFRLTGDVVLDAPRDAEPQPFVWPMRAASAEPVLPPQRDNP